MMSRSILLLNSIAIPAWLVCFGSPTVAQAPPTDLTTPVTVESELIVDATVVRAAQTITVTPDNDATAGELRIPRFFASIRNVGWLDGSGEMLRNRKASGATITLTPEPEYWSIVWKDRPEGTSAIRIVFDQTPLLSGEVQAIKPTGDGSFRLLACKARTSGEKIRYEPQQHKNTVGYWVGPDDHAQWTIEVRESGKFNVAILQGCGAGQGGSDAAIRVLSGATEMASIAFVVEETGHFQSFKWRHLGVLTIAEPGTFVVEVRPEKIARNALMDIRELQLVRLPNPK